MDEIIFFPIRRDITAILLRTSPRSVLEWFWINLILWHLFASGGRGVFFEKTKTHLARPAPAPPGVAHGAKWAPMGGPWASQGGPCPPPPPQGGAPYEVLINNFERPLCFEGVY